MTKEELVGCIVKEKWPMCKNIYKVEKVDAYFGDDYALLSWVKRTMEPGAMWVKLRDIERVFLWVGGPRDSPLPEPMWKRIEVDAS